MLARKHCWEGANAVKVFEISTLSASCFVRQVMMKTISHRVVDRIEFSYIEIGFLARFSTSLTTAH